MKDMDVFNYQFYCTGQEMYMTDCPFNLSAADDSVCNQSWVAGVECEIGNVSLALH